MNPDRDRRWCRNCEFNVSRDEMRTELADDDRTTRWICPGCDTILIEEVAPDEAPRGPEPL